MATLTLTSVVLTPTPTRNQTVNIKIRKTDDPDVASSYTNVGDFIVLVNGNFYIPVTISGLTNGISYTVWYTNPCSNSSQIKDFLAFSNVEKSGSANRNNCSSGGTGSLVLYVVPAGTYISYISQSDADDQAQADVNANKQEYANINGTCTYLNIIKSGSANRNNCSMGGTGSSVIYTVPAGTYSSIISQADADAQAQADVDANKQAYANINGICTYLNIVKSGSANRNNCSPGGAGSSVLYTVPAGTYSSIISQADADAQAQADVDANKQAYANSHGICTYLSVQKSGDAARNDCEEYYTGTIVTYTVLAGAYTSTISQADADAQAQADVDANKQAYANTNGECIAPATINWTLAEQTTPNDIVDADILIADNGADLVRQGVNGSGTVKIRAGHSLYFAASSAIPSAGRNPKIYLEVKRDTVVINSQNAVQTPGANINYNESAVSGSIYNAVVRSDSDATVNFTLTQVETPYIDANLQIKDNTTVLKTAYTNEMGTVYVTAGHTLSSEAYNDDVASGGLDPKIHHVVDKNGVNIHDVTIDDTYMARDVFSEAAQGGATYNIQANSYDNGVAYSSVRKTGIFKRNNCSAGQDGTTEEYVVSAGAYQSAISQADADAQAQADVDANGQNYANSTGICLVETLVSTILIDYLVDSDADLCLYCNTPGVAESFNIVASTANGGPLQYPNDGRDPAVAYLLSSDKLAGPPKRRFGINIAYFIKTYPGIDDFTFILQGRTSTAQVVNGSYAKRNVSEGHLVMNDYAGTGLLIPGVSSGTSATSPYGTHVPGGADGTVGVTVGSPILALTYTVSTDTLTKTQY